MVKFKIFLSWEDEKEEAWLESMSLQGWHLSNPGPFGCYTFTAGEPRRYVYRLDFRSDAKLALKDYFQLFEDAGWEYIGNMGGWHYFRKEVQPGESAEIFTDNSSKIAKYQRYLLYMLLPMALILNSIVNPSLYQGDHGVVFTNIMIGLRIFFIVFFIFFGYVAIRTVWRIRELKQKRN